MAAPGRQQPACGGQQRAVTRSQLRALDLTTQNLQLMAQHEQLDVLGVDASAAAKQQLHTDDAGRHRPYQPTLSLRKSSAVDRPPPVVGELGGARVTTSQSADLGLVVRRATCSFGEPLDAREGRQ